MNLKLKKLLTILLLSLNLVLSSPLHALAQAPEAPSAPTASDAIEASPAPEASQAPEASPAPDPDPSPSAPPDTSPDTDSLLDSSPADSSLSETNADSQTSGTSTTNSDNGPNSTNDSDTSSQNSLNVDVTNAAVVDNDLNLAAVTGDNSASGNTGGASTIETGNALLSAIVQTTVNSVTVAISGGACCSQSNQATNSGNGTDSTNTASAASTNNTNTNLDNDSTIKTVIDALSKTGNNEASYNTGGDSEIITGDANLVTTIITDANAVNMGIYEFDVNGNQTGDIILTADPQNCVNCGSNTALNKNNGSDSTNSAQSESTNTTTETVTNDGDIVNNIDIKALSGNNEASYNTNGDSQIATGDANVVANVISALNTVVDGVIYTVNIFGDLVGNILLPDQAPTASADCGCCNQNLSASNSGNGSDSTNVADASSTNTNTTTQTNNATINNNLDLDAQTGNNETSFNTAGSSTVDTGDVSVDANVINVVNVNLTGGPCDTPAYMVFVNDPNGNWQGQIAGATPGTYFYTSDGLLYVVDETGDLIAVNTGNGTGSTNTATASSTNTSTTNISNTGSITNDIDILASSGDNSASYNTGGDSKITTGNANIALNVINFINSNFSGRRVVMTVVNVIGSWIGHFVPPGFAAPSSPAVGTGGTDQTSNQSSASGSGGTNGSNSSSSQSTNNGNNSQSQAQGSLARNFNTLSGSISSASTEKSVTDDNSISLAQNTNSSQSSTSDDSPFDLRFFLALGPGALLVIFLRRLLTRS